MNGGPDDIGGTIQLPGMSGFGAGPDPAVAGKVKAPAIALMIMVGVGICFTLLGFLMQILGISLASMMGAAQQENPLAQMMAGTLGIAIGLFDIAIGVVIFLGAKKMMNLQSYSFAMVAAILAMIPCISPCCILGLPIGIWALVVLLDPNVKAAFRP